jgi:hypothetical protein
VRPRPREGHAALFKLTRNWHFLRTTVALLLPSVSGMEVMAPVNSQPTRWNDDRLDEFAANVSKRFDQVDKRFDRVDREFARVNDRFDDLIKMLLGGFITLIGVVLAGIFTLVATQL